MKNLDLRLQGLLPHHRGEHAGARKSPLHLGERDLGTPQVIRCWQSYRPKFSVSSDATKAKTEASSSNPSKPKP